MPMETKRYLKSSCDRAQLSLDFIIGISIFLITLSVVATMTSGLFFALSSRTIDYDAVAYRTSVLLVEDPGWAAITGGGSTQWESDTVTKDEILRLGLRGSTSLEPGNQFYFRSNNWDTAKYLPNAVSLAKVKKFFSPGYVASGSCDADHLCYPDEYRSKLLFSQIPYSFNITLKAIDDSFTYEIGDNPPTNSGFIRRIVMVRNAEEDQSTYTKNYGVGYMHIICNTPTGNSTVIPVVINHETVNLYQNVPAEFQNNFTSESEIVIRFSEFTDSRKIENITIAFNLTNAPTTPIPYDNPVYEEVFFIPNSSIPSVFYTARAVQGAGGITATENSLIILNKNFIANRLGAIPPTQYWIFINCNFDGNVVTDTGSFTGDQYLYTPFADYVTSPVLKPAILEVKIW